MYTNHDNQMHFKSLVFRNETEEAKLIYQKNMNN